jgi:hypothetical protein
MGILIAKYSTVFFLAMIKFFFAPLAAWKVGFSFWEVYLVCFAGAITSFCIFYLSSKFFMKRAREKSLNAPSTAKVKRKFTWFNKLMVRMKMSKAGFFWVVFLAPNFASVPLGSIIVAKFYGDRKSTFWYTVLSLAISAFLWTFLWMMLRPEQVV